MVSEADTEDEVATATQALTHPPEEEVTGEEATASKATGMREVDMVLVTLLHTQAVSVMHTVTTAMVADTREIAMATAVMMTTACHQETTVARLMILVIDTVESADALLTETMKAAAADLTTEAETETPASPGPMRLPVERTTEEEGIPDPHLLTEPNPDLP